MAVTKWMTLTRQCLLNRISVTELGRLLQDSMTGVDGIQLAAALVDCRESFCAKGDPLISLYLEYAGVSGLVKVSETLLALIHRWNQSNKLKTSDMLDCATRTLQDITMLIVSPKYKTDASEAQLCLTLSSKWLIALTHHFSTSVAESATQEHNYLLEALAFLLASLAATEAGLMALSQQQSPKDASRNAQTLVQQAIEQCLSLYPNMTPQLVERLNAVVKHITMISDGSSQPDQTSMHESEMQALQFQVSIPQSQIVASKAATVVYLDTLLSTGATIDDGVMLNFLSTRHQSEYQSMFVDLFTAAFQTLRTHGISPGSSLRMEQCQVFIQSKLPSLLSMISASSFNSVNTEEAITDAWHQVSSLLTTQDLLTAGHKCLHTCSLHHLISPQIAAQLVGSEEITASFSKGLYSKDDLVSQVMSNHSRGPKLIEELTRSDGSAGPLSQAIVEVMQHYCQSKETQYLKDLANAILRKPSAINCISLFIRPAYWIGPLCALIDDWSWDEIHGEAQPVYDEFGAIFLLILVSRSRLGLRRSELGIRRKDGFIADYFERENSEYAISELSEDRDAKLGEWINALYLADGLSDELFSNCSPHDYYLLIPTLLRQSVMAHQFGKLSQESLTAGLDYLLESFLLPSLIPALNWTRRLLDNNVALAGVILQVLTKSPSSADSLAIHQTILATAAPRLKNRLETTQSQDPNIQSALTIFHSCPDFSFVPEGDPLNGVVNILATLQTSITNSLTSLPSIEMADQSSPRYTPALMRLALRCHGPDKTLRALIEVLLQLSNSHNFLFALDLISTVICIAEPKLRDALRIRYSMLSSLIRKGDALTAEAVVRLNRQVEAYTIALAVQDMNIDQFAFTHQMTNIDTANANLDAVVVPGGPGDGMDLSQDPGQEADSIDQVLGEVAAMGNLDDGMGANDVDLSFDALYGSQNGDMNLEDLNDLDLDMF